MLYPLTFHPIFKERVWGGRRLVELYGKALPPGQHVGESWEISDRPGDVSVIANGPFAGKGLRWLMDVHGREVLGEAHALNGRFPLLIKILDAQETLSLQVHPPPEKAAQLGGEPKTELWHITAAVPGAELFVGLKRGVSRGEFERRIRDGSVAECFHRIQVSAGDTMFLPSGRVHALGAGLVLFEVQQNSDTTYRVFDWNRVGLDGKPRELHVVQSLASIDFTDFEPALAAGQTHQAGESQTESLVQDPLFQVEAVSLKATARKFWPTPRCLIFGVISGKMTLRAGDHLLALNPGQFGLVPAVVGKVELCAVSEGKALKVTPG